MAVFSLTGPESFGNSCFFHAPFYEPFHDAGTHPRSIFGPVDHQDLVRGTDSIGAACDLSM